LSINHFRDRCSTYNKRIFLYLDVPESPIDLNVTNISYSTISIKWKPGFDGGWSQSFWVSIDDSLWKETNQSDFTFTSEFD
jgi:hypothetical protein